MFQRETVLRKLQRLLSGKGRKLFDNQVSFYNALFGMTNPEAFSDNLMRDLETGRNRRAIEAFFRNGLDRSSSNISKHINDEPGKGIPRHHCVHFSQDQYQAEICWRLTVIISYCLVRQEADPERREMWRQKLLQQLKSELSQASRILDQTETADDALLATILYEIIRTHLSSRRSPEDVVREQPVIGKINMDQQLKEYYRTCDCYEATSVDFFFALQRLAAQNVIAASNLAGFYYVGTEFVVKNEGGGPHGKYVVEKNLKQAAYYFKRACSSQPPYAPALYSYGYMLFHGEVEELPEEERLAASEQYYRQAARQQFHHAVSGLGDLALLRVDMLLKEGAVSETDVIDRMAEAVSYYERAEQLGSFWGPIRAAQFLDNPAYEPYRMAALTKSGMKEGWTAREKWKRAVALGNVFAMEQLALLDLRLGEDEEAFEMLERAACMNYPNASLHLALYFYHTKGRRPDERAFWYCLEKAAHEGSARASLELGKLALEQSHKAETAVEAVNWASQANDWFGKAEKQNHACFEKEVYDLLRQYRRQNDD